MGKNIGAEISVNISRYLQNQRPIVTIAVVRAFLKTQKTKLC
jgi:hypothetical protein